MKIKPKELTPDTTFLGFHRPDAESKEEQDFLAKYISERRKKVEMKSRELECKQKEIENRVDILKEAHVQLSLDAKKGMHMTEPQVIAEPDVNSHLEQLYGQLILEEENKAPKESITGKLRELAQTSPHTDDAGTQSATDEIRLGLIAAIGKEMTKDEQKELVHLNEAIDQLRQENIQLRTDIKEVENRITAAITDSSKRHGDELIEISQKRSEILLETFRKYSEELMEASKKHSENLSATSRKHSEELMELAAKFAKISDILPEFRVALQVMAEKQDSLGRTVERILTDTQRLSVEESSVLHKTDSIMKSNERINTRMGELKSKEEKLNRMIEDLQKNLASSDEQHELHKIKRSVLLYK